MKTCFLILAHSNPGQLEVLLEDLVKSNSDVYIHIDKKSSLEAFVHLESDNIFFIEERVEVFWGEFSIVEATLNLLKVAVEKKYDYYTLLSGSDILVQTPESLVNFLRKNKGSEFINIIPMPSEELNKPLSRVEYYTFTQASFKKLFKSPFFSKVFTKVANKLFKNRIKRNYKKKFLLESFYAGSQWWALSNDAVTLILKYCDENIGFIDYFKHVRIPDEIFFQTILGNSNVNKNMKPSLTFSTWQGGKSPHPKELGLADFYKLKEKDYIIESAYGASEAFIARKFASQEISKKIIAERD